MDFGRTFHIHDLFLWEVLWRSNAVICCIDRGRNVEHIAESASCLHHADKMQISFGIKDDMRPLQNSFYKETLKRMKLKSRIMHKGTRGHEITERQQSASTLR